VPEGVLTDRSLLETIVLHVRLSWHISIILVFLAYANGSETGQKRIG